MSNNLNQFEEMKHKYQDRMSQMIAERNELSAVLDVARMELKRAEIADFESNSKATRDAITKARTKVEQTKREAGYLDERIELFKSLQGEKLREAFPALVEEYVEVQRKALAEMKRREDEIMRKRAEIVLAARDINAVGDEPRAMLQELQNISSQLDIPFNHRFNMPLVNWTSNHAGGDAHIAPTSYEIAQAHSLGKVEPFIDWFAISGELVSNNEAYRLLNEQKTNSK